MQDDQKDHEFTGAHASEIDPATLAELTRALLPYLGPYSITTEIGRAHV